MSTIIGKKKARKMSRADRVRQAWAAVTGEGRVQAIVASRLASAPFDQSIDIASFYTLTHEDVSKAVKGLRKQGVLAVPVVCHDDDPHEHVAKCIPGNGTNRPTNGYARTGPDSALWRFFTNRRTRDVAKTIRDTIIPQNTTAVELGVARPGLLTGSRDEIAGALTA